MADGSGRDDRGGTSAATRPAARLLPGKGLPMRKLLVCLALFAGVVTVTASGCKSARGGSSCSSCGN